jgi:hypothetical protein
VCVWSEPDVLALLCWLHRDTLIARLESEIDIEADDANALTDEQRAIREAELLRDMLATERAES